MPLQLVERGQCVDARTRSSTQQISRHWLWITLHYRPCHMGVGAFDRHTRCNDTKQDGTKSVSTSTANHMVGVAETGIMGALFGQAFSSGSTVGGCPCSGFAGSTGTGSAAASGSRQLVVPWPTGPISRIRPVVMQRTPQG